MMPEVIIKSSSASITASYCLICSSSTAEVGDGRLGSASWRRLRSHALRLSRSEEAVRAEAAALAAAYADGRV